MKEYSITWEINALSGNSPLEAAKTAMKWIAKGEQQFYVQDEETKKLFSVDLSDEGNEVIQIKKNDYNSVIKKGKMYYLFGEERGAIQCYSEDGICALLHELDDNSFKIGLFIFTEGITKSIDLLSYAMAFESYVCITEEEYDLLEGYL